MPQTKMLSPIFRKFKRLDRLGYATLSLFGELLKTAPNLCIHLYVRLT